LKEKIEIIFYYPRNIQIRNVSGGSIRPFRMISAFEKAGLIVHKVMGDFNKRKKAINLLKEKIKSNLIRPTFVYIESSTMPLPFSSSTQFLPHPFLEFNFLNWLKKRGVRIGLFYRDIYWKFPEWWKRQGLLRGILIWPVYYYELYRYIKLVDILFCPSLEFMNVILNYLKPRKCLLSAPGCDINNNFIPSYPEGHIILFYVGGCIPPIYDLSVVLKACKKLKDKVDLKLCVRKEEWAKIQRYYKPYLDKNIKVYHVSGTALKNLYLTSHIFIMPINKNKYRTLMMPIKLFESIGYSLPIIAGASSAAGRFIKDNNIGWTTDNNLNDLTYLLIKLIEDSNLIKSAVRNIRRIQLQNTWQSRADYIINELKTI
jgi:glycosyltransferase involved in cell wall biosynthesis